MRGKIGRRLARYIYRHPISLMRGKALVSFTFDDVPQSACIKGADIVASEDRRATYYVCGGLERSELAKMSKFHTARDLVTLSNMGHEVASHGYEHINYQCSSLDEIACDIKRNNQYLFDLGIPTPSSFAFPFGCVNPRVKKLCSQLFTSCRGAQNAINFDEVDMSLLKTIYLYSSIISEKRINLLLDKLCESGGWLIFLSHGVTNNPGKFDIDPGMLKYTLKQTLARDIEISTVADTVEIIGKYKFKNQN